MPGIELNLDQWPVIFTKFDGDQTLEEIDQHIREYDAIYRRGQLYANVVWIKHYSTSRDKIDRMGRWMKETEAQTRSLCIGTAMITKSVGFRFVLSAVMLIRPMVVPYVITGIGAEALAFVREQAKKRNLALPQTIAMPWADAP